VGKALEFTIHRCRWRHIACQFLDRKSHAARARRAERAGAKTKLISGTRCNCRCTSPTIRNAPTAPETWWRNSRWPTAYLARRLPWRHLGPGQKRVRLRRRFTHGCAALISRPRGGLHRDGGWVARAVNTWVRCATSCTRCAVGRRRSCRDQFDGKDIRRGGHLSVQRVAQMLDLIAVEVMDFVRRGK